MLGTFLCICWPFVFFLLRTVYGSTLPISEMNFIFVEFLKLLIYFGY